MTARSSRLWSLPGARQIRQSAALNSLLRAGYGPRWGRFGSRSEAENFPRQSKRASYDSAEIVAINLENFREIHHFDWPVLFALQKLAGQGGLNSVVDFGGHVGAKYYAFREILDLAPNFKWQIVDVPAVCEEGRNRLKPGDEGLSYSDNLENIIDCDALLCSGSLQYFEEDLDALILKIIERPQLIILNKVALSENEFYTLEAFGGKRMPYRVVTQSYLDRIRKNMKYRKTGQWVIPDMGFEVPHQKGSSTVHMVGEIWVLEADAAERNSKHGRP